MDLVLGVQWLINPYAKTTQKYIAVLSHTTIFNSCYYTQIDVVVLYI